MNNSASAGGILVNDRGEIVLAELRGAAWGLPRSRMAPGETPLAAALRDVRTETGLDDIHYQGALPVFEVGDPTGATSAAAVYPFLFTTASSGPLPGSGAHAEWVTLDRAVSLLPDADREIVEAARPRIERLAQGLRAARTAPDLG